MSKFTRNSYNESNIKSESEVVNDIRVVKLDKTAEPVVEQYAFGKLHRKGEGSYAATKAKYGALAATDTERTHREQKDRRFSLNPLLRDPLSIEEEERRVIEVKVAERVAVLCEIEKEKAREKGYQIGLKQGHDASFKQFQEEAAERMGHFEGMLHEAETAKVEMFRGNERFLMEMLFRMARMVTLKELSTDRDYVLRLTRELIERMGVRENIRIRIHPDDAATAEMLKPGIEKSMGAMQNVQVEVSDLVHRGGCMIETEWNNIDASLDTQFQGVYEALVGKSPISTQEGTSAEEPHQS